jgi:hypothetical protein
MTSEIQEKDNTRQQEKQNPYNVPYPGFKLWVGWHEIELRVNSGPVLETGEAHAGVPGCCHVISIVTAGHLHNIGVQLKSELRPSVQLADDYPLPAGHKEISSILTDQ